MRALGEPTLDDAQIFDDIIAAKAAPTRNALESCRERVIAAYQDYEHHAPHLEVLNAPTISDRTKTALHHAYSSPTRPMNKLRSTLTAPVASVRCPFCGISEATTLDHYLPKELYPMYAVYSKNLVPCCSKCNTQKSTKIFDQRTGTRQFLHPYFDVIPQTPFLDVTVRIVGSSILLKYQVVQANGMSDVLYAQLQSHFRELQLGIRYRLNALHALKENRNAYRRHYLKDRSGNRLIAQLREEARDLELEYGPNDWRCVLYRALAEDQVFVTGGFELLFADQI